MTKLQRLPKTGDSIEFDSRKFSVEEMDGLRVGRVKIEAVPTPAETKEVKISK
jgi:CBS domain containing-hemolysin-like protein